MRKQNASVAKKRTRKEPIKCFETTIIGGSIKGKKILIPDIKTTRSSKSILRESFFNTLQLDIIDKNFVEVFAGSGSVGIEALSRGAKSCYFIEKNRDVFSILQHNLKLSRFENSNAVLGDSFVEFQSIYQAIERDNTPTYFYFDPPFSTRDGMNDIYNKTIDLIKSIDSSICQMVIIEHMTSIKLPQEISKLQKIKQKKFGKSSLSYYAIIS